jgi:hypothetical protein
MVDEYKTVSANNLHDIERKVKIYLDMGFDPSGPIVVCKSDFDGANKFIQVMVRFK